MIDASINYASYEPQYSHRETRRKFVVKAVFFIFILSLIEGPLRKWILPSLSVPLTLLRDPFVLVLYAYCISKGMIWKGGIARLWLGFATITVLLGLVQYAVNGFGLTGWILGLRTYWLYMPLAFVVAKTFTRDDIHRFFKMNLWIAMPYAMLVTLQYNAPPMAIVNSGVGGDYDVVGLADGIVRPFGLFTYTGPNVQFTTAMIAMFLAFYVSAVRMRYRMMFLLASGAAVGAMSVLTGSRGIYFLAGFILIVTVAGIFLIRPSGRGLQRILGILGFICLTGLLFIFVFPDMLDAMSFRFENAAASEGSIWGRAFGGFFVWIDPLFTAPAFGAGIGAGAPGVANFLGLPALIYGESDLQRNVNELGLFFGVAMLLLRFGTSAWIVRLAYRTAKNGDLIALPLAGFVLPPLLIGQITHSPLTAFLVWLAIGFLLSMKRVN
jgi:hypothetical protein